jgi:signal transduction histidine kinase
VQDLLAVLNEALSNVARHAAATEVAVTLACSPEGVLLRVADNGRGLTSTERSSGLTNLRRRAEQHGGSFVCRANQPTGTVVEWMVPVAGR